MAHQWNPGYDVIASLPPCEAVPVYFLQDYPNTFHVEVTTFPQNRHFQVRFPPKVWVKTNNFDAGKDWHQKHYRITCTYVSDLIWKVGDYNEHYVEVRGTFALEPIEDEVDQPLIVEDKCLQRT